MAKINPSDLQQMIAEAAYYRAERRNFEPGYELQDWLEAEQTVAANLKSAKRLIATANPIEAPVKAPQRKATMKKMGAAKTTTKRAATTVTVAD